MRKVVRRLWVPAVILVLGGIIWAVARPQPDPGVPVGVAKATQGQFVREVRATGSVDARVYTLSFPRPGRVARVLVKEGQSVKAGTVLAELETTDETVRLASARENLSATITQLRAQGSESVASRARVQSQLESARKKLDLTRRLVAVGAASRNELEEAGRAVRDLESQLTVQASQSTTNQSGLEATRSAREAEIKQLERTINQSRLRAPVDGTVSRVDFLSGVETGASTVRLVQDASLEFRARLAEADIRGLKVGQPAVVKLDAAPNQPLQAKVARLSVQAEVAVQGGNAILPVVLRFTDPQARTLARPGLTASVRITTLRLQNAVIVPLETITEERGTASVWVVDAATRTVKKTSVTVQARNLTQAAVQGLESGTILVSLPPETLADAATVQYALEGETKPVGGQR
jgi:multidrug efflux pump subunit AcrA (membrane-fusion protein)